MPRKLSALEFPHSHPGTFSNFQFFVYLGFYYYFGLSLDVVLLLSLHISVVYGVRSFQVCLNLMMRKEIVDHITFITYQKITYLDT